MILKPYTVTVLKHPKKLPTTGLYDGKTQLIAGPEIYLAKDTAGAIVKAARGLPTTGPDATLDTDELDFVVLEMGASASVGSPASDF